MPSFQWQDGTGRYRDKDTGRFVSATRVRGWVDQSLAVSGDVTETLASMVNPDDPAISSDDWNSSMRQTIKSEYIRQYMAGRGGRDKMTQSDWGSVGGSIADQYRHLERFTSEIEAGNLSEAQIRARSRMYTNSAREAFERAREQVEVEDLGKEEVRWVLNSRIENCQDCQRFAGFGWVLVSDDAFDGCMPGSGCTQCLCITTPTSRVLTHLGWKPMCDVRVGEFVLTHNMNWREVTDLIIKPSEPYHRQVWLRAPSGKWVGATDNHLWWTDSGWLDSNGIRSYNGRIKLPYVKEVKHGDEVVREVREAAVKSQQAPNVQGVFEHLPMWEREGFQGHTVRTMCKEAQGVGAMVESGCSSEDVGRACKCRSETPTKIREFELDHQLASQAGRAPLRLLLGGGRETLRVPLPMGVAAASWADSSRLCHSSQGRGCQQRRTEESGVNDIVGTQPMSWHSSGSQREAQKKRATHSRFSLLNMRDGVYAQVSTGQTAEILFSEMLRPGTPLYDLTVEGDESFVIEGLFAHNTNCGCHKQFRRVPAEERSERESVAAEWFSTVEGMEIKDSV